MRILKENSVVLAIDIQSKLFPLIYEHDKLESDILKLIAGVRTLNLPVIVTEQYPKGIGETIESIKNALGDDYKPIEKNEFSCCGNALFMDKLSNLNKEFVILFGIESHVCVLQTVIDLSEAGFVPVVIEDCVSSRKLSDKTTAIERMKQEGAIVSSCESILFELLVVSGTEEFKKISKIIK